jgi:Domain of unknown function (DUF1707)
MTAPSSPTWLLASARRRSNYGDMRISDSERAEVADLLSKHYGDGRLDQAEFNERLDQAMRAKTYADLDGLFADLPPAEVSGAASGPVRPVQPNSARRYPRVLFLVLIVAVAAVAGRALAWSGGPGIWPFGPWVWIGLLVFVLLRYGPGQHRHR